MGLELETTSRGLSRLNDHASGAGSLMGIKYLPIEFFQLVNMDVFHAMLLAIVYT